MRALTLLMSRIRRAPSILIDAAIAAAIFTLGFVDLHPTTWSLRSPIGFLTIGTIALAFRRKTTWTAFLLVQVVAVMGLLLHVDFLLQHEGNLVELVALYTVAESNDGAASLLSLLGVLMFDWIAWHQVRSGLDHPVSEWLFLLVVFQDYLWYLFAWYAGRAQDRRRILTAELEKTAAEVRGERDRLVEAAVATERSRIARDLHALVARGLEDMNRETRSALVRLEADGARVLEAIVATEARGRETLVQMRRLLSVLRKPSGSGEESSLPAKEEATTTTTTFPRAVNRYLASWIRRPWIATPKSADVLVVALLAWLGVWEGWLGHLEPASGHLGPPFGPHRALTVAVLAVEVGAHIFRRTAPFTVLLAVAATIGVTAALQWDLGLAWGNTTGDLSLWIAVYTVAALRGPQWAIAAILVEVAAYAPLIPRPGFCDAFCLVGWSGLFVFAAVGGTATYLGRLLNEELRVQTDLLRRTREERIRASVTEERTRVARDLHDVVAHGLTVMVVQAGAARALVDGSPSKALEALVAVERAGGDARRELGSLMGSLGSVPVEASALPDEEHPSIRSLVHDAMGTGLHVELSIEAERDALDPGLEISLYRIVQEALTNVRKHAPGARAWIQVRYSSQAVELEVTDSGSRSEPPEGMVPGAGQGLIGIAERAALFGGDMEAGPTAEGGFRLRVRLLREPIAVVMA